MSQRTRQARDRLLARRARLRRVAGVGVLVMLIAGALLAFGSRAGSRKADGDGAGTTGTARVSMTEFAFDPDPIVLQHGAGARLEVVNEGATAHDLLISQLGKGTPDLPPGESMLLDLSDQPTGTYRVVCDLPGHTEAGMVTELTLQ